jgi:large subunit ribosomal protein L30
MPKVKITKIKSTIDKPLRQKNTVEALGLSKLNSSVEHELTPQIQGMLNKVNHLIKIEQI